MSNTLSEIYSAINESVTANEKLNRFNNDSKMSVINAIEYVVAGAIYSFEKLMDVFLVDIATILNSRINGTPQYYAAVS